MDRALNIGILEGDDIGLEVVPEAKGDARRRPGRILPSTGTRCPLVKKPLMNCATPCHRTRSTNSHGSAPDIAGKGIANPYAMTMSGQMLLAWRSHKHQVPAALTAANLMERATENVVKAGKVLTRDMGDAIVAAVDII